MVYIVSFWLGNSLCLPLYTTLAMATEATQPLAWLFFGLVVTALSTSPALSQYSAPTGGRWLPGRARLFIADNSAADPAIAVVDLPSYNLTQRISVPGTVLQLGVSTNSDHLGVFRNRDNDQQASLLCCELLVALETLGFPEIIMLKMIHKGLCLL